MSDHKTLHIRRTRTTIAAAWTVFAVAVIVVAWLREAGHVPASVHSVLLTVWVLMTVGWCTAYLAERDARLAKRAKQLQETADQLTEAARVAGWATAMEQDQGANVRQINRR